jgi:hypothetical protein
MPAEADFASRDTNAMTAAGIRPGPSRVDPARPGPTPPDSTRLHSTPLNLNWTGLDSTRPPASDPAGSTAARSCPLRVRCYGSPAALVMIPRGYACARRWDQLVRRGVKKVVTASRVDVALESQRITARCQCIASSSLMTHKYK